MTNYDDLPLSVTEEKDGSFTIEWDENDPRTAIFNSWTEDDFIDMIRKAAEDEIIEYEERKWRTEFAVDEFEDNFDELFARVENGETLTILHPDRTESTLIMPITINFPMSDWLFSDERLALRSKCLGVLLR